MELAEPGQRLLARIVDTLVVGLPVAMVVREVFPGRETDLVLPPAVAGVLFLYEWLQLAVWGRTIGKRFAGIQVVRMNSGKPGVWRALPRAAVYSAPIALRPVAILGVLAGLFWVANVAAMYEGSQRQALHDRLAGTVVVKRSKRTGYGR
ncbi:RDD family protein [Actinomadura rudentiformis]|uniref:RDD family protein n=1 Tax=Actinomadura rudentiformis TaxID=359158 RepID=A0A6H9YRN8_9ACTN|nr:RDD family protein [Actinomadura rudentiformis]KAB2350802.1 RDD family protein [Actinomadura rudentiformis]